MTFSVMTIQVRNFLFFAEMESVERIETAAPEDHNSMDLGTHFSVEKYYLYGLIFAARKVNFPVADLISI